MSDMCITEIQQDRSEPGQRLDIRMLTGGLHITIVNIKLTTAL